VGRKATSDPGDRDDVRLDVWLDVACLFKTRSEAQKACHAGKVTVNGRSARPNRPLRAGDDILIGRPHGRTQHLVVRMVAAHHVAKGEARQLYEDLTPPPTAEEIEMRRIERLYRAAMSPPRAPDKRERRDLRRLKGRE
jgi:ribosome-associated heat shock protein Hsp15